MNPTVSQLDAIQILLHEYDSLSNQLRQLDADQFQIFNLVGIAATALIALFSGGKLTKLAFIWSGSVFLVIFTVIWLLVDINVAKASRGIARIERAVNTMVGQQRLLSWETRHGFGGTLGKYFVRNADYSDLPLTLGPPPPATDTS